MSLFRIALANLRIPRSRQESVTLAEGAIAGAAAKHAEILCFPECFVAGYRGSGRKVPPPDAQFVEQAWSKIAGAAEKASVAVILGTEREVDGRLRITALVINADGSVAGFQDKVQLDPSEEST